MNGTAAREPAGHVDQRVNYFELPLDFASIRTLNTIAGIVCTSFSRLPKEVSEKGLGSAFLNKQLLLRRAGAGFLRFRNSSLRFERQRGSAGLPRAFTKESLRDGRCDSYALVCRANHSKGDTLAL